MIKEAWKNVTTLTIQNSFKKSKFCNDFSGQIENDELEIPNFTELDFDFTSYSEIDNNVECSEPLDERVIVANIPKQKQDGRSAVSSDDDSSDVDTSNAKSNMEVLESMNKIEKFLTIDNIPFWDCFTEMDHIIQRTILQNVNKLQQGSLDN